MLRQEHEQRIAAQSQILVELEQARAYAAAKEDEASRLQEGYEAAVKAKNELQIHCNSLVS